MIYEFCTQTDTGLLRENNEDAALADEANAIAVLADGMGGYNAGEVASDMATKIISAELGRWLSDVGRQANVKEVRKAMDICVHNANLAVYTAAAEHAQYAGMGTTLVAGVFLESRMVLGHIGDSRCYRSRNRQFVQLTKDHSLLQEQLDAGLISPEQAAISSNRNLVTRALGIDEFVQLEIHDHAVEPGDLYLMCSDGLSDMVDDDFIAKVMETDATLEQKAKQLIGSANACGGRDNITVLLVQANAGSKKRGLMARLIGS
ncbi:protein phosphatase [Rhodoferax koreense]|uniref:Protein phosphatase n=1 Tax=Rhodoferax koreensis TaxID=1842727 RepID=A0A1P8K4R3_9BURK|nr:Stp1/IreP family PP2C-type Ser/Thr phosphatase [Rhodoferax koreense]APW40987.1 protein phosphatase [Rhodoferax koreense]